MKPEISGPSPYPESSPGQTPCLNIAVKVQQLSSQNAALLICDMQEKFRGAILKFDHTATMCRRMLQCAQILDMPRIVAEMYPEKLGKTVPELQVEKHGALVVRKIVFSMAEVVHEIFQEKFPHIKSVIICGIASHVCVFHSCIDLLLKGYDVYVVADACSAATLQHTKYSFRMMERMGAFLMTSSCIILSMVKEKHNSKYEAIRMVLLKSGDATEEEFPAEISLTDSKL